MSWYDEACPGIPPCSLLFFSPPSYLSIQPVLWRGPVIDLHQPDQDLTGIRRCTFSARLVGAGVSRDSDNLKWLTGSLAVLVLNINDPLFRLRDWHVTFIFAE